MNKAKAWERFQPGHDDVIIKWRHFSRYWPFVRGIHRSPVDSPHKGQWRGALMFFFICAWTNAWANNRDAGDFRCHLAHYDVTLIRGQYHIEATDCNKMANRSKISLQHKTREISVLSIFPCRRKPAIFGGAKFRNECRIEVDFLGNEIWRDWKLSGILNGLPIFIRDQAYIQQAKGVISNISLCVDTANLGGTISYISRDLRFCETCR